MSFATADFEVIQQLRGFKLSLFLAVRHEEFLGGGVCKLSLTELSDKYTALNNESNTARVRKEMIGSGWFVEVVGGGIVTKKFNDTAKIAGTEEQPESETSETELQNLQSESESTAKIAVTNNDDKQNAAKIAVVPENELQFLQQSTAKIAGTEVANKDLEFKEIINKNTLSPPAREDDFPDAEILESGRRGIPLASVIPQNTETPEYEFNQTLIEALKIRLKSPVKLPDEFRWSKAIEWAWQNRFPAPQAIEVFDLLETVRRFNKGRWSISPELWQRNIAKIESLREEAEELKTGVKPSGKPKSTGPNGINAGHSSTDFDDARFAGKIKAGI